MQYVKFKNRSFGFKGDRGTYVAIHEDQVTIVKAKNGMLSQGYWDELCDFCSSLGVSFKTLPCGGELVIYDDELEEIASSLVDEVYERELEDRMPAFKDRMTTKDWLDAIKVLSEIIGDKR